MFNEGQTNKMIFYWAPAEEEFLPPLVLLELQWLAKVHDAPDQHFSSDDEDNEDCPALASFVAEKYNQYEFFIDMRDYLPEDVIWMDRLGAYVQIIDGAWRSTPYENYWRGWQAATEQGAGELTSWDDQAYKNLADEVEYWKAKAADTEVMLECIRDDLGPTHMGEPLIKEQPTEECVLNDDVGGGDVIALEIGEPWKKKSPQEHIADGWNACRAALLATQQPSERGLGNNDND